MKKLPILAAAAFIALGLAGCTASETGAPAESTASASAEAGSDYVVPEVDGTCVDGTATIAEDSSVTVTGAVSNLTFNSSISLVSVADVANVTFSEGANGNKVVTPAAPAVTDNGQDNLVAAE
jgi:PBP1b-binding outer membrane lipoprotein LpoB